MAKEKINVVRIDTDPAKKSLKDLRKELMDIRNEMVNLEEGSDAFLEMAQKGGELQHQISEIGESIRGASSDFGDMVGNATNVMAGITGAFQAVAGGLQAMGMESEALDKTIARMQGLMAVTQGLSAIDDGIKSFDKLTASMGAAGAKLSAFVKGLGKIAAPIAIVTALGVAFTKLKSAIDGTSTALNKRTTEQNNFNTALQKELEIRKRAGFTEEETLLFEISQYELRNQKLNEHNAALKAENDQVAKNAEASRNAASMFGGAVANQAAYQGVQQASNVNVGANTALMAENTKEINKNNEALAKAKEELDIIIKARQLAAKRAQAIVVDDPTLQPSSETPDLKDLGLVEFTDQDLAEGLERVKRYWEGVYDIQLEQNKRSEKSDKEKLAKEIEIEEERLTLYKEGTLEYEKQLTKIWELENGLKELTKSSTEEVKTKIDQVRELGNATFETLKDTMGMFGDSSLGLTTGWVESLNIFQDAFTQTMDIVKEKGKSGWTAYGDVAATALSGIGSMLNALSQEQDVSTEEGFKQQKALQISATVMNMLSGVMSAWTSAMNPANSWMTLPGQIAMGTITSAMVAGIGAAQIAKIKSQTMNSAIASGAIQPSPGALSSMVVPPVQMSSAVQGANTEGAIRDSKVYVTETDIKNTMNKVSVQENENIY